MSIRKAEIGDATRIRELVSSLSHFYLEDKDSSLPAWFLKTLEISEFERRISSSEYTNYVYTENSLIIGYISIKDENHLYHLFVDEDHQGKGISKKLWNYATSKSNVYTVRSSMFAVPVYRSFGFQESEEPAIKDGIGYQPMVLVR